MVANSVRSIVSLACAAAVCCALAPVIGASEAASSVVVLHSDILASTSLRVSSSMLKIDRIADPAGGSIVIGTIDFRAAARTRRDGDVVLTVETPVDLAGMSPGAVGADAGISFEGIGDGARTGMLRGDAPQVAGRWVGSGVRSGQLVFTLNGSAASSGMTVPLRFVLSLP